MEKPGSAFNKRIVRINAPARPNYFVAESEVPRFAIARIAYLLASHIAFPFKGTHGVIVWK